MLIYFLIFILVVAPAWAAFRARQRDRKAERLIAEVRAELAARDKAP